MSKIKTINIVSAPQKEVKLIEPEAFTEFLQQTPRFYVKKEVMIDCEQDMMQALLMIDRELPQRIEFYSNCYTKEEVRRLYDEVTALHYPEKLSNLDLLVSYKINHVHRTLFVLLDASQDNLYATQVNAAFSQFVKILATQLKGKTEFETVLNLYNYIYSRFTYTAKGIRYMIAANIGTRQMACNGFSKLVDATLKELKIKTYIRSGFSHYWNIIEVNGQWMTFDVTTDIILQKKYLTLGNSSKQHCANACAVGFYNVDYKESVYQEIPAFVSTILLKGRKYNG